MSQDETTTQTPIPEALQADCPWPEDVWPMTTQEYVAAVPDEGLRTAISGFLMRQGWNLRERALKTALAAEAEAERPLLAVLVMGRTLQLNCGDKPGVTLDLDEEDNRLPIALGVALHEVIKDAIARKAIVSLVRHPRDQRS